MTGTICSVGIYKSNADKAKKSGEKISFFSFPTDNSIGKEWIKRCYRKGKFDPKNNNKRICSQHFTIDDFEDGMKSKLMNVLPKMLKKSAILYLNLLPKTSSMQKMCTPTARQKCLISKDQKEVVENLLTSLEPTTTSTQIKESIPSTSQSPDPEVKFVVDSV